MKRTSNQLSDDVRAIWQAGVDAVRGDRLVRENVRVEGSELWIGDREFDLGAIERIVVVGAGKAGAGMTAGLEEAFGERLMVEKRLTGWINVPADCVRSTKFVPLHAARPAGLNEPTSDGVDGTEKILRLVEGLGPRDLCVCLLSGGGSALLPAPAGSVTLADKQAVTRHLSAAGANIEELNTVRKQLSRIKGGGLARACNAGHLVSLIISDVIGDPLDVIASGPTVPNSTTARDALDVLDRFDAEAAGISRAVFDWLRRDVGQRRQPIACDVANLIVGNNAVAVDAAGLEAERRGYSHAMAVAERLEGSAEEVGSHLADMARRMRDQPGPDCLITGGEPTVTLIDAARRGLGGRNQQLVLAALARLLEADPVAPAAGIALLAGGTDGEDGPTDAAGAAIDAEAVDAMRRHNLDPAAFLARNDAYHFFEPIGGLIKSGPTHTNVCDVRVVAIDRIETNRGV